MTEAEASNKVCPEMSTKKDITMCCGDDCAWWLWNSKNMSAVKDVDGKPLPRERWTGFCGKIQRQS